MLSVIVAYISQIEQMFSGDSQINCELVSFKIRDDDRGVLLLSFVTRRRFVYKILELYSFIFL